MLSLGGCGGSSGGPGGGGGGGGGDHLSKLTDEQRKAFEQWKTKVVKSCDASQAFNSQGGDGGGIDVEALIKKNENSLVFSEAERLVVLTGYQGIMGVQDTKYDLTVTVNGSTSTISARTHMEGTKCELYLFEDKIFETTVAQTIGVGLDWRKGREGDLLETSRELKIDPIGRGGLSEISSVNIHSLISDYLRPGEDTIEYLARKFEIKKEAAQNIFRSELEMDLMAMRFAEDSSSLWTDRWLPVMVSSEDKLRTLFDGNKKSVNLEVDVVVEEVTANQVKSSNDNKRIKLIVPVSVERVDGVLRLQALGGAEPTLVPFDGDQANECARSRVLAYLKDLRYRDRVWPSVGGTFGPCHVLHPKVKAMAFDNGLMKELVLYIFESVQPRLDLRYEGWDEVLSDLTLKVVEQGGNIENELDPQGVTLIVPRIGHIVTQIKGELDQTTGLEEVKKDIYRMGMSWIYKSEDGSGMVRDIVLAVQNTFGVFPESTKALIEALNTNPMGRMEQVQFALKMDGPYKDEAVKSREIAKALSFSEFDRNIFAKVIQQRISLAELQKWTSMLTTIKSQIEPYTNLEKVKEKLIHNSVKWLESGAVTNADELGKIYRAINNVAVVFESSTVKLVDDLEKSLEAQRASIDFALGITDEYKDLASKIPVLSEKIEMTSWGARFVENLLQDRPTLDQVRAWHQTLVSAGSFYDRETELTKDDHYENDRRREDVLRVALNESWTESDFVDFEVIAKLGMYKSDFCSKRRGKSSMAGCGNLSLFSTDQGRLFDRNFGRRYVQLSKTFEAYLVQLRGNEPWGFGFGGKLFDAFFDGPEALWSKCHSGGFDAKVAYLDQLIKRREAVKNDIPKRWEVEREITEKALVNCP